MGGFLSNLGRGVAGGLADTGKMLGGVFEAFSDEATQQRERSRQQKNALADQEFAAGLEALKNTAVNLQRAKDAGDVAGVDKYSKLYSYEEESLGKLMKSDKNLTDLFGKFGGAIKQHFTSKSGRPPSPGQQALPVPGAARPTMPQQAPGASGMDPQILAAAQGPTPGQQKAQEFQDFSTQVDQMVKSGDIDEKEAARLKREGRYKILLGLSPASLTAQAKMTPVQLDMKDGSKVAGLRDAEGNYFMLDHTPIEGASIKGEAAKPSSARAVVIAADVMTTKQAIELAAQGKKFLDEDDNEIDLSRIPPNMILQAVELPGGKTRYRPRGINDKTITVGGVVYAVNPMEAQQLGQGAGTALGPSKTGTVRTAPITVQDEKGNFVQLPGVTTPATPGVTGRPTPGGRALPPPNVASPSAAAPTAAPATTGPTAGSRTLSGMVPAGQVNAIQQRATPVRIATSQIFGDPKNPDLKALADYADLADNKESSARIATAVRLARSAMLDGENQGGHVGATVGPISVGTGGLGQWATTAMGVPVKLTESQNKAMQEALSRMSPREREAFNAIMATYGTVAGLRALTKAGVAQANMANIEQEIPLIGFNVTTKADFVDKLKRLGEEIQQGAVGVPPSLLDTSQVKRKLDQLSGAAQIPDTARKQLKEGTITTFQNGQSWTLRNGQPVRVQ